MPDRLSDHSKAHSSKEGTAHFNIDIVRMKVIKEQKKKEKT